MTYGSIPPKVGEYAYFDSRRMNKDPHWLIGTDLELGCHYSLPTELSKQPFITCHGKILKVGKCIKY